MRFLLPALGLVGLATAGIFFRSHGAKRPCIIGVAVSLKPSIEQGEKRAPKKNFFSHCHFSYGSSFQLAEQIKHGAPIDGILSADAETIDTLDKQDLIEKSTITAIATSEIYFVRSSAAAAEGTQSFITTLTSCERIALPPAPVPLGRYGRLLLTAAAPPPQWESKLFTSENAAHTLQLVRLGAVDCGVIYRTDALALDAQRFHLTPFREVLPNPAEPTLTFALTKTAPKDSPARQDFFPWLKSKEFAEILWRSGLHPL